MVPAPPSKPDLALGQDCPEGPFRTSADASFSSANVERILASDSHFAKLIDDMTKEFRQIHEYIEVLVAENAMLRHQKGGDSRANAASEVAQSEDVVFKLAAPKESSSLAAGEALAPKKPFMTPAGCTAFGAQARLNGDEDDECLPDNELTEMSLAVVPHAGKQDKDSRKRGQAQVGKGNVDRRAVVQGPMLLDQDAKEPTSEEEELKKVEQERIVILRAQERRRQFQRLAESTSGQAISVATLLELSDEFEHHLSERGVLDALEFLKLQLAGDGSEVVQDILNEVAKQEPVIFGGPIGGPAMTLQQYLLVMVDEGSCVASEAPRDTQHVLTSLRSMLHVEANDYRKRAMLAADKEKLKQRQLKSKVAVVLDLVSVAVILMNSLMIGFSIDIAPEDPAWDTMELTFFCYYVLEIAMKMYMFGIKSFLRGPDVYWNLFDTVCVLTSLVDLSMTYFLLDLITAQGGNTDELGSFLLIKMFRMARLTRILRVVRFKMFKELKLIILGLFSGLRALFWAVVLLMFIIYAMGVAMKMIAGEVDPEFETVPAAMFTLFRCFTEGCAAYDGTPLTERLRMRMGGVFLVVYILCSMMVTVGIFNLIMAVFIDNVTKSQQQRKQKELGDSAEAIEAELKIQITKFVLDPSGTETGDAQDPKTSASFAQRLSEKARCELARLTDDESATGSRSQQWKNAAAEAAFAVLMDEEVTISREVFHAWLLDSDFLHVLEEAEVDISNKFELFDILDVDMGGELSALELVGGLMKLRGDVSKGDIVSIMLKVQYLTQILENFRQSEEGSDQEVHRLTALVGDLRRSSSPGREALRACERHSIL